MTNHSNSTSVEALNWPTSPIPKNRNTQRAQTPCWVSRSTISWVTAGSVLKSWKGQNEKQLDCILSEIGHLDSKIFNILFFSCNTHSYTCSVAYEPLKSGEGSQKGGGRLSEIPLVLVSQSKIPLVLATAPYSLTLAANVKSYRRGKSQRNFEL